jgi:hypothetical protein
MYTRVLQLIETHRAGRVVFAGPDAPEVYFLSDSTNPTRSVLDFLDTSGSSTGIELVSTLLERRVPIVVINSEPLQSPPLEPRTLGRLRRLYPESERVGRFEVRWRDLLAASEARGHKHGVASATSRVVE